MKQSIWNGVVNVSVNIISIALSSIGMLWLAYILGASGFGKVSTALAVSGIILPFLSLKGETRIAVAKDIDDLHLIYSSVFMISLISFFGILLMGAIGLSISANGGWIGVWVAIMVIGLGQVQYELLLGAYAFKGNLFRVNIIRIFRIVPPPFCSILAANLGADVNFVIYIYGGSIIIGAICFTATCDFRLFQMQAPQTFLRNHGAQLRNTFAHSVLNVFWTNSLIPLLSLSGNTALAGLYSAYARAIGTPLAALTMAVKTTMLRHGNQLHRQPHAIVISIGALFLLAMTWSTIVSASVAHISNLGYLSGWEIKGSDLIAIAIFVSSSFAFGTISIVSLRLHDEHFLALWQLLGLILFLLIFHLSFGENSGYLCYTFAGAWYFILGPRWVWVSVKKNS